MKQLLVLGVFVSSILLTGSSRQGLPANAEAGGAGHGSCRTDHTLYSVDANGDATVNMSDVIFALSWLFGDGQPPRVCLAQEGQQGAETGLSPSQVAVLKDLVQRVDVEPRPPGIEGFTFLATNPITGLAEYVHDQTSIEFVLLPGGTFNMGSPEHEPGRDGDEGPVQPVTVSAFLIAKYEVTRGQWFQVMGNHPSYFTGGDPDRRPVEDISYNDIQEFEARTMLVLPSEAQ